MRVITKIPPRKPTISERREISEKPIISIFGGVRSSSALRLFSSRFLEKDIKTNDKENSN